jgi:acetyl esterase/lipase
LLPESTGLEALEDAVDALNWVSNNVAKRVITAGSSAGGYLALAAGANPQSPPLLAILSVYGMLDLTSSRYVAPGTPLPGRSVDAAPVIQIIETLSNGNQSPISGYAFPVNPATDPRNRIISIFHQEALYLDVMTREKGLAERVRKEGIEAIPTQYRELFPAAFGLTKNLPPVALLHGEADSLVAVENSVSVAAKLENLGVKVLLQTYDKGDHGFDVRGIPSDVDIDKQEVGEPLSFAAMRNVIQFLDAAAI